MNAYVGLTFSIIEPDETGKEVPTDYNILLYTVSNTTVRASSSITSKPLVTGDYVMDHMYRNADTVSISGVFSKIKSSAVINDNTMTLAGFQKLMEKVKDRGIPVSYVKYNLLANNEDDGAMFVQRNNLILDDISWTENINTIDYSFSFKQVMFVEPIIYDVTTDDNYCPNVKEPVNKSFTESVLNKDAALAAILTYLNKTDFISETFWNKFWNIEQNKDSALAASIIGGVIAGGLILFTSTPIGWALAAGAIAGLAIYCVARGIRQWQTSVQYKTKPFKDWSTKEQKRFRNFIDSLEKQFEQINNSIKSYFLSSDEDQQIVLSFADTYYVFTFTTDNSSGNRYLTITDDNDNPIVSNKPLNGLITDITSDISKSNYLIYQNDNYCFITYLGGDSDADKKKLTNYAISISTINPANVMTAIVNIVKANIYKGMEVGNLPK